MHCVTLGECLVVSGASGAWGNHWSMVGLGGKGPIGYANGKEIIICNVSSNNFFLPTVLKLKSHEFLISTFYNSRLLLVCTIDSKQVKEETRTNEKLTNYSNNECYLWELKKRIKWFQRKQSRESLQSLCHNMAKMFSFGLVQEPHIGFYILTSPSNGTSFLFCDLIDIYNISSFIWFYPLPPHWKFFNKM